MLPVRNGAVKNLISVLDAVLLLIDIEVSSRGRLSVAVVVFIELYSTTGCTLVVGRSYDTSLQWPKGSCFVVYCSLSAYQKWRQMKDQKNFVFCSKSRSSIKKIGCYTMLRNAFRCPTRVNILKTLFDISLSYCTILVMDIGYLVCF